EKLPAGTVRHALVPTLGWYRPGKHCVAWTAPDTLTKLPAGASRHAVVPVFGWYWPIEHSVAAVMPDEATKDPAGASVHGSLPVPEKVPGRHAWAKASGENQSATARGKAARTA
ncbi:MAG TPA: hypothetical protein PLO00_08335, partial [Usitatibacteraceae bacterium]|nr:hypothetical protein [Usitatibacteraceae bacterium]